ncbi:MAG: 4-hydroxy-tetrahydrodipicolinate synthase [Acidimicrobiia bacterium]|nr:4-hydroxy-tetrahydrodipicolinate synthase [Acidimicrobiia bacterium]
MGGRFGSVLTAMVSPFDDSGTLDLDAAATIARFLQDQGNDGLVVAGTTGEASTLSSAEKLDLWRAVSEAVTIPVIAGTGSNDTAESVELTRAAAGCGAAGVLVVGPYYNRPPQSGLERHFRAVAEATDLPVVVYDVPVRTGRRVAADVLLRLFRDVPNVVAFKDATGDPPSAARLVAELGAAVELYSGDDAMTLPLLAVGAVGVIGVATHWTTPEHVELFAAWEKGDAIGAREVNARLLPSFEYENSETCVHAQSAKAALRVLGLPAGECRLPVGPAPDGTDDRAREVLRGLGRDV